jgi:hypothetical protein
MAYRTRIYRAQLQVHTIAIAMRTGEKVLTQLEFETRENATGGPYSRGTLANSVYKQGPIVVGKTVTGTVGARAAHARWVETGTDVHDIFPKGAPHRYRFGWPRSRPMLRFVWRGRLVYMHQVPGSAAKIGISHPGQAGKHFLAKALVGVAARNGFRVIVYDL